MTLRFVSETDAEHFALHLKAQYGDAAAIRYAHNVVLMRGAITLSSLEYVLNETKIRQGVEIVPMMPTGAVTP